MDTVKFYNDLDITNIQTYLSKCDKPFETSPLYSTETEETYVDTERRLSVYRTIVDPDLFDLVEDLMTVINQGDNEYQYVLWKNGSDITHIKYEEGGFFKCHRDFNSTTSNMIEEFSLIICVTPEDEVAKGVEGGETSIVTFGGVDAKPTEKVFDTKTPGSALLFRKDLNHEGKKLMKGVKHIITANIFAVKNTQSEQVLYVTFPEAEEGKEIVSGGQDSILVCASCGKGEDGLKTCTACNMVKYCNVACQKAHRPKHKKECMKRASELSNEAAFKAKIQLVANDSKSYALPVSRLTGMLEAHVRFYNAQVESGGQDPPQVVPFICRDFTYEQFGVVASTLNRCYVDIDSIKKEKACLDYFGPFNVENILVDLALEPSVTDGEPPEKKQKEDPDTEMSEATPDDFDTEVIVCENEARMKVVLDTARAFDQPYVPFKILFIEGMLQYFDGDGDGLEPSNDVPMTAAATFVGDHNNVFALWCLDQDRWSFEQFTLEEAHNCTPFFHCAPASLSERILGQQLGSKVDLFDGEEFSEWDDEMFEVNFVSGLRKIGPEEFLRGGMGLGLNVRASDSELKSGLLEYMFNKHRRANFEPLDLRAGLSTQLNGTQPVNSMFHLDGDGKACFTREQAENASDYIAEMKLDEKVKASLQKKRFELPQVSEKVSMVYCNDDRYGKMNVLWVCGILRLDDSAKSPAEVGGEDKTLQEFDAWPSEEAKEKIEHAKRLGSKYMEIIEQHPRRKLPDKWWEYDSDESTTLEDESD